MIDYASIDLTGAIDIHIHSSPDVRPRKLDDLELAQQAASRGMRAILLKSHWTQTANRAYLVEKVVQNIRVFGGLALNSAVGGLNPAAVEAALQMGAVEIWMPTLLGQESAHHSCSDLSILKEEGGLKPSVVEILQLIAEKDAILGTGHLPPIEIDPLILAAHELGVRKIIVTHPEHPDIEMPLHQQEILRDRYEVYFERCLINTPFGGGAVAFELIADAIRKIGAATTIISTDFGQPENVSPVDGFACYLSLLRANGFTDLEIVRMSQSNPAELLGL